MTIITNHVLDRFTQRKHCNRRHAKKIITEILENITPTSQKNGYAFVSAKHNVTLYAIRDGNRTVITTVVPRLVLPQKRRKN